MNDIILYANKKHNRVYTPHYFIDLRFAIIQSLFSNCQEMWESGKERMSVIACSTGILHKPNVMNVYNI